MDVRRRETLSSVPVHFRAALPLMVTLGSYCQGSEHSSLMDIEYFICLPDEEEPPGLALHIPVLSLWGFFCVYFPPKFPLGYRQRVDM